MAKFLLGFGRGEACVFFLIEGVVEGVGVGIADVEFGEDLLVLVGICVSTFPILLLLPLEQLPVQPLLNLKDVAHVLL